MKPEIIDAFRKVGIHGVPEIKGSVARAKADLYSRGQLVALESNWRRQMAASGQKCKCGRGDMLTVDHIIPKMLLRDFGVDVEREWMPENLELMCRPCNALKSGHLDFSNPKTKEMLVQLLSKL